MNDVDYLKNLLNSFFENEILEKVIFIKHFDSLNVTYNLIEDITGCDKISKVVYHSFIKNDIQKPYEPFLDIIKDYYYRYYAQEYTVSEFVDKCNVYFIQRSIFESYIKDGVASREEPIIISEVNYEKKRFIESLFECFKFITKSHKLYFVFNNFQLASLSTMRFIMHMLDKIDELNLYMLIIYNELQSASFYKEDDYKKVITFAEDKDLLYECDGGENTSGMSNIISFTPVKESFSEYLTKLRNLNNTLALEDAEYCMKIIYDKIVGEKFSICNDYKFDFYVIRAVNYIHLGNVNSALFMCDNLVGLYDPDDDLEKNYIFYYTNGLAHMMLVQSELTAKYARLCKAIATEMEDDKKYFDAEVLECSASYGGWKDVFSVDFNNVRVDEQMLEKLEKNKYFNTLAYYYAYGKDNDDESIEQIIKGTRKGSYIKAKEIAQKSGNMNLMLSVYTKYTVVFTDRGYHKFVDYFYEEKFKIHKKENDVRRSANLLLGMGYNAIISEQAQKANELFNNGIRILYELRQPEAIAEALYNMAVNEICEMNYYVACNYLTTIFKMIDNLGIETIQICNSSKLQGLLGVCYLRLGNDYRCYTSLSKIEILLGHLFDENSELDVAHWYEDLFLMYYLKGMLEKKNGNNSEALECFKFAKKHFEAYPGAKFYNIINFVTEYADLLDIMKIEGAADKEIDLAIQYCSENGYNKKAVTLKEYKETHRLHYKTEKNVKTIIPIKDMIDLSYNIGKEREVEARKKDINFLSVWQEMLNRDDIGLDVLVENAVTTLQNYFNFDNMLFLMKDNNDKIEKMYKDDKLRMHGEYEQIFDFFEFSKKEFLANRTNKSFLEFSDIVSIFDKANIVTVVGVPIIKENKVIGAFIAIVNIHKNFRRNRVLLNEDNLVIIKTAIVQLSNGLERLSNKNNIEKINKKLNELAITDLLTGLYNRQGLNKMVEMGSQSNSVPTVLYVDLDNFKYYNDTFGHDVGDIILVNFAKVFMKVSENCGYAIRYGGDEFLVVLNRPSKEEALDVARTIYKSIENGFIDEVTEYVNHSVIIPQEKKISCSIGIAVAQDSSMEAMHEALRKADEALYYIKKHGKGQFIVWEDVSGIQ